ncbi:MAG TPA: aminoglycoside phosphotransferase family protein [Chitinophagaceae bacterium]|nr:aminoglycoside phosphotransferase family protein [Chitinophagaceae bacterium]
MADTPIYAEAISRLFPAQPDCQVDRLNTGLINYSFKVTHPVTGQAVLLQQINHHVFPEPRQVQDNFMQLWDYKVRRAPSLQLPEPLLFSDGQSLWRDSEGRYWRAFVFLAHTKSLKVPQSPRQASATARAFGEMTAILDGFDSSRLHEVIPGFHDLGLRYRQFEEAVRGAWALRRERAAPLIESLQDRVGYRDFFLALKASPAYPLRVMHHDAKIANVLFDDRTGEVVCLVDFDTVMPGRFFSDLGDLIRSMACSEDENSTRFADLHVRRDVYRAILSGYLEVMAGHLTIQEKEHIHFSGLALFYMQALRFLTDYLQGDRYYLISYAEQNFDRALNQVTLLKNLEGFLKTDYNFTLPETK